MRKFLKLTTVAAAAHATVAAATIAAAATAVAAAAIAATTIAHALMIILMIKNVFNVKRITYHRIQIGKKFQRL